MLMMRNDEMDPTEITPHLCLVHAVCKIIFFFTQMCLPMHIREQHGRFKSTVGYRDNLSIIPQFFFKNNKFQTAVSLSPKGENSLKLPSTYHIESRMFLNSQ